MRPCSLSFFNVYCIWRLVKYGKSWARASMLLQSQQRPSWKCSFLTSFIFTHS